MDNLKELLTRLGMEESALHEAVESDLQRIGGAAADGYKLEAIPGGASIRGYARLTLDEQSKFPTMALMILSDPDPAKGVEEVMASGVIEELPFINVHRHLEAAGVAVPEILHYNVERGLIYMEDLGATHLRQMLESGDQELARRWFEESLEELVKIHVDADRLASDGFLGFMVKFDHKLLRWELDHFTEYAIDYRFPDALTGEERALISESFEAIVEELLGLPYTLQHRDYQLDNLLIKDGRVRVIDFQDALMGPLAYDLACLLFDRDTSALLGPEPIEHLVEFYADAYEKRSGEKLDRGAYRRCYELCVIHRMLKVVGRFHFIDQVKKRPEYLGFNKYMLPVIADYLGRGPGRRKLLEIIVRRLPEMGEFV